jgi:hypothetical protein
MPQNVFIMLDPLAPTDPTAWIVSPLSVNVYPHDRTIEWKVMPGALWNGDAPIVINDWPTDQPRPIPNSGNPPRYGVTAPDPPTVAAYIYNVSITFEGGTKQIPAQIVAQPGGMS